MEWHPFLHGLHPQSYPIFLLIFLPKKILLPLFGFWDLWSLGAYTYSYSPYFFILVFDLSLLLGGGVLISKASSLFGVQCGCYLFPFVFTSIWFGFALFLLCLTVLRAFERLGAANDYIPRSYFRIIDLWISSILFCIYSSWDLSPCYLLKCSGASLDTILLWMDVLTNIRRAYIRTYKVNKANPVQIIHLIGRHLRALE